MIRSLFILLVMIVTLNAYSQKPTLEITDSISGDFSLFSIDNLGRVYLAKKDVIWQYSAQYQLLFSASLKTFVPSSIETSKTFRALLFDRERSTVMFLDNTLSDIYGQIDLVQLGIQQPILVAESFAGNTFWVLDASNMRLVKIDKSLKFVAVIENLSLLFEANQEPNQMIESSDRLFVSIPNEGVAIFDVFGTYLQKVICKPIQIAANGKFLFVLQESSILVYDVNQLLEPIYSYPAPKDLKSFTFYKQHFYYLDSNGLKIGQFKEVSKNK